jgi:hypothetical protein
VFGRLYSTLKVMRRAFKILEGNVDGRDFMGVTHADQKMILKRVL